MGFQKVCSVHTLCSEHRKKEVQKDKVRRVTSIKTVPIKATPTGALTRTNKHKTTKKNKKNKNETGSLPVGGRLTRFKKKWTGSGNHDLIARGLSWMWKMAPPLMTRVRKQRTSPVMDLAVKKMSKKRVILKSKDIKHQSMLFTVPKKDSVEDRVILDLSELNDYIICPTFKMLTLSEIRLILPRMWYTAALDLKDGFWHVPIFKKLRAYLGFIYRGQGWTFRAMPFGLNVAPRTFTKLIKYMIKVLAAEGIWCLPYLDDLLIIAQTKEECLQKVHRAISVLEDHGWIINFEKSRLDPQQVFEWLGMQYDLDRFNIRNTIRSMTILQEHLIHLIQSKCCTKKQIMRLQGLANWTGQVNPLTRLILSSTKTILSSLSSESLNSIVKQTTQMKMNLIKWIHTPNVPQLLGIPKVTHLVQSDASKTGWGFQINQDQYMGNFDISMRKFHIGILETLVVWFSTLMIQENNAVVHILTDNITALAAVRRPTSKNRTVATLSELIWRRATTLNWTLTIAHISGKFNVLADQLSRDTTISTEWSLQYKDFQKILKRHPLLQVDLFATRLNNQLPNYVSPCPDQNAVGVNAMSIDWNRWDHLYLYPPTPMISKALPRLLESNFKSAILITPDTPTQPWFMALKLRQTPSHVMKVWLRQVVGNRLEYNQNPTNLRVWKLSRELTLDNSQVAHKQCP